MNRPLRIFFGQFVNGGLHYADNAGDQVFPDFLLGTYLTGSTTSRLHSRQPSGAAGDISNYDEYLDLNYSGLGFETANTIGRYKNIAGVESQIYWADDVLNFDPTNILTLQTHSIEFGYPTRRLSLPYPKVTPVQPILSVRNSDTTENAIGYFKIWATIWDAAGAVESSPSVGAVVAYATTGVNCDVNISYSGGTTQKYSLYRAEVIFDTFRQEWILKSLPLLLTNHDKAALGVNPKTFTTDLCDIAAEPYKVANVVMTQPALNDARARVKFDFLRHRRFISGVPSQKWLLLNVDTHQYYKGVIGAVSDVFLSGWAFQDAKSVQISLMISEEGLFVDDAINNPNTSAYFVNSFQRSIV